jgi:hypothetical protein
MFFLFLGNFKYITGKTEKTCTVVKFFFSGVGLFYIYQNLAKDVNFQDSLRKFQDLSCM